jgi:hypothetical protein
MVMNDEICPRRAILDHSPVDEKFLIGLQSQFERHDRVPIAPVTISPGTVREWLKNSFPCGELVSIRRSAVVDEH